MCKHSARSFRPQCVQCDHGHSHATIPQPRRTLGPEHNEAATALGSICLMLWSLTKSELRAFGGRLLSTPTRPGLRPHYTHPDPLEPGELLEFATKQSPHPALQAHDPCHQPALFPEATCFRRPVRLQSRDFQRLDRAALGPRAHAPCESSFHASLACKPCLSNGADGSAADSEGTRLEGHSENARVSRLFSTVRRVSGSFGAPLTDPNRASDGHHVYPERAQLPTEIESLN